MLNNILPNDPGKRDLVILALIVVPLMVIGVIWGILGNFDDGSPPATPVPPPSVLEEMTPGASPTASPAAFVIVDPA